MEEIKKILKKAFEQVAKFDLELIAANLKHFDLIWDIMKRKPHEQNINEYMPDIDRIMPKKTATKQTEFKIGQMVNGQLKEYGSSMFCFGLSDDATSLIEDNEKLRQT